MTATGSIRPRRRCPAHLGLATVTERAELAGGWCRVRQPTGRRVGPRVLDAARRDPSTRRTPRSEARSRRRLSGGGGGARHHRSCARGRSGVRRRPLSRIRHSTRTHALRPLRDRGGEVVEVGRKVPLEERRPSSHAHRQRGSAAGRDPSRAPCGGAPRSGRRVGRPRTAGRLAKRSRATVPAPAGSSRPSTPRSARPIGSRSPQPAIARYAPLQVATRPVPSTAGPNRSHDVSPRWRPG